MFAVQLTIISVCLFFRRRLLVLLQANQKENHDLFFLFWGVSKKNDTPINGSQGMSILVSFFCNKVCTMLGT